MTTDVHTLVHAEIDRRRDEIVAFLSDLVRFPSVNHPPDGDEFEAQQFVAKYFAELGLEVDEFQPDEITGIEANPGWWPGADFTNRPNVIGTRRGTGGGKSLLLLAHIDVVPEGPQELWRHGPFNPVIEGDALIGRGSADDKSGIATQIMALKCLEAAGFRPRGDVILASVVDEESAGANGTLAALMRPHVADGCVYTDGMQNEIHVSQLGGVNFDIQIQLHPDVAGTTIEKSMQIMPAFYEDLQTYLEIRKAKINADHRYAGGRWPEYAVRVMAFLTGSVDGGNAGGGRIRGSAYVLPGESVEAIHREIEERVQAVAARFGHDLLPPKITPFGRIMPPSAVDVTDPFVGVVGASYERATGHAAPQTGMPMSDLFQFLLHSPRPMPTVATGCGTWGGPGGVHEPNEAVLIDEHLIPLTKMLASLIINWCGVEPAGDTNA